MTTFRYLQVESSIVTPIILAEIEKVPADWFELPVGGVLEYVDGTGTAQTLTIPYGQPYSVHCPETFYAFNSCDRAIRFGTGSGPASVSAAAGSVSPALSFRLSIDYTDFDGLAAGVTSLTEELFPASMLPSGAYLLSANIDQDTYIPFTIDGAAVPATAELTVGANPTDTEAIYDGTNLASPSPAVDYGDYAVSPPDNRAYPIGDPTEWTFTSGDDLRDFDHGHFDVDFVFICPVAQ